MATYLHGPADDAGRSELPVLMLDDQELYRGLFESAGLGLAIIDEAQRFLKVNPALCEMLGYDEAELLAMSLPGISLPEELSQSDQRLARLFDDNHGFVTQKRYLTRAGEAIWVRVTATPLRDGEGRVCASMGVIENISQLKQAEQQAQQHARRLNERMREMRCLYGVASLGDQGLALEDFYRQTVALLPSGFQFPEQTSVALLIEGKFFASPGFIRRKNLLQVPIPLDGGGASELVACLKPGAGPEVGFLPEEQELLHGVAAIVARISERMRTRSELKRLNLELEGRVQARTDALSQSMRQVRQLIEASPVPQMLLDGHKTRFVSPAFTRLFGYTREAVPDLASWYRIAFPDEAYRGQIVPDWELAVAALSPEQSTGSVEAVVCCSDGQPCHVEIVATLIEQSLLVTFHDVTARKQAELDLIIARFAAEEASSAKGAFLANMSHEIRTPMNAIIGLNLLLEKTELDARQRDYVGKVRNAAQNLLGIINDILDVSKIEAGHLQLESIGFDLNKVFENLSALLALKAADKNLELIFDLQPGVPARLIGDPLRLEQILINLANNAIKFTERGSVTISICPDQSLAEAPEACRLRFAVTDTGIGLGPAQQSKLFQAFSQADASTTRQYGGTGLGLSISKHLTELMGGEIGIESELGVGSTFWFSACFGLEDQAPQSRPLPQLQDLPVLVVDDQEHVLEVVAGYLGQFGMRVEVAQSGAAALALLLDRAAGPEPFRLLLLDWKMPELDGLETLERLWTQLPAAKRPATILMTAYGREELWPQLENKRFDCLLLKPLTPSMVYDATLEALHLRGELERVRAPRQQDRRLPNLDEVRGARLLLVEDNQINQQVACELLEAEGFSVSLAGNGEEALAQLAQSGFDLVLMDLQMPVMDGYCASQAIRSLLRLELPIVAMTADAVSGVREEVLAAGMNDYVTKPIQLETLFAALLRWLPRHAPAAAPRPEGPGPAGEPDLPDLPGVNLAAALERVSGHRAFYLRLLRDFVRDYRGFAAEYAALRAAAQDQEAYRRVHSLKGVSGNLGFETLASLVRPLEQALRQGEATSAHEAPVFAELALLIDRLAAALPQAAAPIAAAKPAEALLGELIAALENLDPAAEAHFEQLLASGWKHPALSELGRAIADFDFETAQTLLESLHTSRSAAESAQMEESHV